MRNGRYADCATDGPQLFESKKGKQTLNFRIDAYSKRLSFAGKPIVVPPILTRARYKEVKPALIGQFIRFVFCLGPSHGKCS